MADKKMTELDNLNTGIASEDLLHVVDSPDSSPVNKKVSVEDFMGNQNKTMSSTDSAGHEHIRSTITVGSSSTTYSGDIAPISALVSATPASPGAVVTNVYGAKIIANAGISTLNTVATSVFAGAYIEADITNGVGSVGGALAAGSRQYGLVIRVNDSASGTTPRAVKPTAMIQLKDDTATLAGSESAAGGDLQYTVSHLLDMANVHLSSNGAAFATDGEGMVLRSSNGTTQSNEIYENFHKIRFQVNGEDMFLLATSNAETQTT